MDDATTPTVIGARCDHRGCGAAVRVRVRLTTGELGFCMHHWVGVEEAMVASSGYVSASPAEVLVGV